VEQDAFFDDVFGWEDITYFDKAYAVAQTAHKNQKRDEGTPYMNHIDGVVSILKEELQIEIDLVLSVAVLHDVLEDSDKFTLEWLKASFGHCIAKGVELLTKAEGQSVKEYLDKIDQCVEMPWLMTIKLADRLNNLRDLSFVNNNDKILKQCKETRAYFLGFMEGYHNQYLYNEIIKALEILEKGIFHNGQ